MKRSSDAPTVPLGEARIARDGRDVTVVSWRRMVHSAAGPQRKRWRAGIPAA